MVEQDTAKESHMTAPFIEKSLEGTEPPRCVDGRFCPDSNQGPQLLGGSAHPIVLNAIYNNSEINQETVVTNVNSLQSDGFKTGAHRGQHRDGVVSDCGFADRMPEIIRTAQNQRDVITDRLEKAYEANKDIFDQFNLPPFKSLINSVFEKIATYDPNRIKVTGEALVGLMEDSRSTVETVTGDHAEEVAFLNIKDKATLDTRKLNEQGGQGFNLDLLPAVQQAASLGVPSEFSIPASLILYQATGMVLVEGKGKPALPVQIHS